jgi:hypothetical protein
LKNICPLSSFEKNIDPLLFFEKYWSTFIFWKILVHFYFWKIFVRYQFWKNHWSTFVLGCYFLIGRLQQQNSKLFESRSGRGVQHYIYIRFPTPIKLTATI